MSDEACIVAYEKLRAIFHDTVGEYDNTIVYEFELKIVEIYIELSAGDKDLINFFEIEMELFDLLREEFLVIEYEERMSCDDFRRLSEEDRIESLEDDFSDFFSYDVGSTEDAIKEILDKYKFCYLGYDEEDSEIINNPQSYLFNFEVTRYGGWA